MVLYHTTLQIVRGVLKAPGDAFSAENDLFVIELQDSQGLALRVDGWSPQLPALKGGGTWAESAIADGRIPLAQPVGNITETLRLTMTNTDLTQRFAAFKKLGLMRQSVIDFWTGSAQIDPVYIRWHAAIGKGEQYALIYNLEVAQETDIFDTALAWDLTLTIEREPYWRGLWPGANPKEWTLGVVRGHVRGSALFDTDNLHLVSDSDHFLYETINNKHEWTPAAEAQQTTFITKNYIEITADQVPGDAPALLELSITPDELIRDIYIGLSTKELSKYDHSGQLHAAAYTFNAGDAVLTGAALSKQTGTASTGMRSNNSSSTFYFVRWTATGAVTGGIVEWSKSGGILGVDRELMRGSYMVFLRGRVNTGAAGDTTITLTLEDNENDAVLVNTFYSQVVTPLTGSIYQWHYFGRVTIPAGYRSLPSLKGYGRQIQESSSNLRIVLTFATGSATVTFDFSDLLFIPIDEIAGEAIISSTTGSTPPKYVLDNTGYLAHGSPDSVVKIYNEVANDITGGFIMELRGEIPTLIPNKAQRLWFFAKDEAGERIDTTFVIRGNIVPRWAGIRDV